MRDRLRIILTPPACPGASGSHMSEKTDGAYLVVEQGALDSADVSQPHLDC